MQVLDEKKREKILSVAAELFARKHFHQVLLSDVAAEASVGKGTLYTYFKNKEELYLSVLSSAFFQLVDRIRERLGHSSSGPEENLEMVVREIVLFAYQTPHLFEMMRAAPLGKAIDRKRCNNKRRELVSLIESIIRDGIASGVFEDTNPEWTAAYVSGLVRSVLMDGIENVNQDALTDHMFRFVCSSLKRKDKC